MALADSSKGAGPADSSKGAALFRARSELLAGNGIIEAEEPTSTRHPSFSETERQPSFSESKKKTGVELFLARSTLCDGDGSSAAIFGDGSLMPHEAEPADAESTPKTSVSVKRGTAAQEWEERTLEAERRKAQQQQEADEWAQLKERRRQLAQDRAAAARRFNLAEGARRAAEAAAARAVAAAAALQAGDEATAAEQRAREAEAAAEAARLAEDEARLAAEAAAVAEQRALAEEEQAAGAESARPSTEAAAAEEWAAAAAEWEAAQAAVVAKTEAEAEAEAAAAAAAAATQAVAPPEVALKSDEAQTTAAAAPAGIALEAVRVVTYSLTDVPGHIAYRLEARVGPFECSSSRCFSDFVGLHAGLQRAHGRAARTPAARQLQQSEIPSLASLLFFPSQLDQHATRRCDELQAYCDACCAAEALARSEQLTAFFWPSPEGGGGIVKAPDGSIARVRAEPSSFAYLTGMAE